jgi:ankyrin repeat protein
VLLGAGADVDAPARNAMQVRPIHSAAAHSDLPVAISLCRRLLAAGTDPDAPQQRGFRPLHEAALRGSLELVQLLLAHGADPRAANTEGKTPIDLADERKHTAVADLLRAAADAGKHA